MVMTVQCPECGTEFPVDPMKVPETGVRAQCSVCPGVFPVFRPEGWSPEEGGFDAPDDSVAEAASGSMVLESESFAPEPESEPPFEHAVGGGHDIAVEEEEVSEAEFQTDEEYREAIELDSAIEYGGEITGSRNAPDCPIFSEAGLSREPLDRFELRRPGLFTDGALPVEAPALLIVVEKR